ncbi:hypothetical protein FRX31_016787 [Thalictrum thalictroides]|uniref:Transmembrane protein n=1 Tax=Thalictrum thalictroides TaxID=46969 RepID=A0A7J6W9U2_THATH|nr:hypothetical protein FRX31_016787 [Thalictrum thalictroides]
MASKHKKAEDIRLYIVSGLLFSCILTGGVFLALSIKYTNTKWYPIAGIILVGIPWIFWLFMYIYSFCSTRIKDLQNYNNKQDKCSKAASPTKSSAPISPASVNDHRKGHVHFGKITMIDEEDESNDDLSCEVTETQDDVTETQDDFIRRVEGGELNVDTSHGSHSVATHESQKPV